MGNTSNQHVDRSAFSVVPLTQADDEREYWRKATPAERIEQLLRLRKMNYGDAASGRLQRVLEITKLSRD